MRSTMMDVPLLLSRILEHGSRLHGASEVVTWGPDGPRRGTYADVGRGAAQLAHALRGLGVDGDQRVATFMWNNQEHLEAYFGIPSMGAVLHAVNIRLFPPQMAYVMNHAEDRVVIVDASLAGPFARLLPSLPTVRHVIVNGAVPDDVRAALGVGGRGVHDYRELLAGEPGTYDWPELDERSGAAMCYTSGTTGGPKGVVYSHRSNYLHAMGCAGSDGSRVAASDRMLAVVPMFHANAWGIPYAALLTGCSLVMPDRFLTPDALAAMIERERVTRASAVPTLWIALLRHLDEHGGDVSTLREVMIGGSACPPALMDAFRDRYGVNVVHAWGMTETSPMGSAAHPPPGLTAEEEEPYRRSQGRIVSSVQARLVGPGGEEVPWDGASVGELQVRGPWVTGSYYLDPSPDSFDGGWLRTGDVGSLTPDGFLTLTDRAKDVIKSGGEWISSVELENALMAHPAVAEASVVGVPDERWGERPLATVVVRDGETVDAETLRGFLAERVARWQVPERWAFVPEVPKTSVGKFDKKVLRRRYADGELTVTELRP